VAALAALGLSGCVSVPTGPSVLVLPGTGKSFDHFQADDVGCRQLALQQTGGQTPQQAANNSAVASAAVGTVAGAAIGAAVGGGSGAAVGAGTGLLVGGAVGADAAGASAYATQQRYDLAYMQCMYGKGNKVPVVAGFTPPPGAVYSYPTPYYPYPYPY
jgi:hypothetical protein